MPVLDLPPTRDRWSSAGRHDARFVHGADESAADAPGSEFGKPGGSVGPDRDPVWKSRSRQRPVRDLAVGTHPSDAVDRRKREPNGPISGHRDPTGGPVG